MLLYCPETETRTCRCCYSTNSENQRKANESWLVGWLIFHTVRITMKLTKDQITITGKRGIGLLFVGCLKSQQHASV